jgi:hypothetical protein
MCASSTQNNQGPHQRTKNTKYYLTPFRKENYEKQNSNQHPVEWEKYKTASKEKKIEFF